MTPTWRLHADDGWRTKVILQDDEMAAAGECIAMVEGFGYGFYPNALPPAGDGTTSMIPGMTRGGCFRTEEDAKAWAERICGLHPMQPGDVREGHPDSDGGASS